MRAPNTGVELRRRLDASVERVFGAFADAGLVARWLRPSPDVMLTVLEFDFRLGGTYRFAYDVPDGRRMIVGGSYRAIERPTRIVFSWLIEPPDEQEEHVMMRRVSVGALAYLVPTFALGFVWHLIMFKSYYDALAMYRTDVIIPFGFLSMSIQAVIFAWIYGHFD
jgi:uncharacterized protein YndB with AHSA1/START domain